MILLQTKNKNKLRLPENCSEVKLSQFIDYNIGKKKWIESIDSYGLFSLESLKSLRDLFFNWFEKDKAVDEIEIDVTDNKSSALNLIKHIDKVIESLKPSELSEINHTFEYKGETFIIPFESGYKYLEAEFNRPPLTFGEVVEVMEYKRLTSNMIEENDDEHGNLKFTESLRTLAILARKDNELLPSVKTELWISDRMHFFKDISLQTYSDVYFFLIYIGIQLKQTNNSIISSTLRRELLEQRNNLN